MDLGAGWTYYDIERTAFHLNMDTGEFLNSYLDEGTKNSKKFRRVISPCLFVNSDEECSIYPARPLACRFYPLKTVYGQGNIECPAIQRLKNFLIELAQDHPHVTTAHYLDFNNLKNSILSQLVWNIPKKEEWNNLQRKFLNENPTCEDEKLFFRLNRRIRENSS